MRPLKTALIGLTETGQDFLEAIRADNNLELVAMADRDPATLRPYAETGSPRLFEDYRLLIIETARTGLDALFIASEPFQSLEFVELAAAHEIAVFHKAPPARNVRETRRILDRFADRTASLVIARPWAFEPAFEPLADLTEIADRIHLAEAYVQTTAQPLGWRADAAKAGGGVLLNGAYDAVDLMIDRLGLPEAVYAQNGWRGLGASPPNYDTEDVAQVTLQFSKRRIATITAVRGAPQASWQVRFCGSRATVTVTNEAIGVAPAQGNELRRSSTTYENRFEPAIHAFAETLLAGEPKSRSTLQDHLPTIAVIEAAYLSARTGAVESPHGLL